MVGAKEKGPMDLKKLSYSEREVMTTTVVSFQLALLYRGRHCHNQRQRRVCDRDDQRQRRGCDSGSPPRLNGWGLLR
jgi:hypothetical protein